MAQQRPLVVFCSGLSLVVGVTGIWLLLFAFTTYRADDFVTATETPDFATKGTCVETVNDNAVGELKFECENDKWQRVLLSQTHSIYYLYNRTSPDSPESSVVRNVSMALTAATIGKPTMSITPSMAKEVLLMLDDEGFTAPTDCSSIYADAAPTYYETSTYYQQPLITCDEVPPPTSPPPPLSPPSSPSSLSEIEDVGKLLYACNKQFNFGRSGPGDDTFGIPFLNERSGPESWPSVPGGNTSGFNETSPWSVKSRMFLGFRFGWSLWAYVPNMLSLAYLSMDAALVLLLETTIELRITGVNTRSADDKKAMRKMLRIVEDYVNERNQRFLVAFALVANSVLWMVFLVWMPWNYGTRLGRPICEEGPFSNDKTQGGWQPDNTSYIIEWLVVSLQAFILFAVPGSRLAAEKLNICGSEKAVNAERSKPAMYDNNKWETNIVQKIFTGLVVAGVIIQIFGVAWSGTAYGKAWAAAVAGESVDWNETEIALYIYDSNLGALVSVLTGGFVIAVVFGRYMFSETFNCESLTVIVLWAFFGIGAFIPLLTVYTINMFIDDDQINVADCDIFKNYDDVFAKDSCIVLKATIGVGTGLIALVVAVMTVTGVLDGALLKNTILNPRKRGPNQASNGDLISHRFISKTNDDEPPASSAAHPNAKYSFNVQPRYASRDQDFYNYPSMDDAKRSLLTPDSPQSTPGTLRSAAPDVLRFSLNPAAIMPANHLKR